ncbi:hypothetical protein [Burkholderia mayonis]|uniref:hypothetical protein n=1 Tax=Burkholderia mayonis TaxID=1385591 RepID=UPI000AFD0922|nr:hypothetical protein [Burkholderia mayonis]
MTDTNEAAPSSMQPGDEATVEGVVHPDGTPLIFTDVNPNWSLEQLSAIQAGATPLQINQIGEAGGATENPTDVRCQDHAPVLGTQSDANMTPASGEAGNVFSAERNGIPSVETSPTISMTSSSMGEDEAGKSPSRLDIIGGISLHLYEVDAGPNVAASPAAVSSASDTLSSALPASSSADMRMGIDFDSAVEAFKSIGKLRAFLWTFETGSMRHLHAELDKLEALFK